MVNNFEKIFQERLIVPRITLNFFRHSIKENRGTKPNQEVQLTKEGRDLARSKHKPGSDNAVAFGSSYDRTQETALLVALGLNTENFIETKAQANLGLDYGSRLGVDDRLDFKNSHDTDYYKKLRESFSLGQPLKFIIEESDNVAAGLSDLGGATYSRMASQIAEIVKKYSQAIDNWSDVLEKNPTKYDSQVLERFLGTHRGLGESFLAKVIEKTMGEAERNKFMQALNNDCFKETEGFKIDIGKYNDEKIVYVLFDKLDEKTNNVIYSFAQPISSDILDEIIKEGKESKEIAYS